MKNILNKLDIESINDICKELGIENYTINSNGSIDVNGDVDLNNKSLTYLPIKFNKVSGKFYCRYNSLTSLLGSPIEVGATFSCSDNELSSLEHCPKVIGGDFIIESNNINSLVYFPDFIGDNIFGYGNPYLNYISLVMDLSTEKRKIFFKYQNTMGIWDQGGYNSHDAEILIEDINDGLL